MVEIFQIIVNLVVLCCLARVVFMDTTWKYATMKDLRELKKDIAKRDLSLQEYSKRSFDVLRDRIADIEQSQQADPMTEQDKYIRIGADLMREGVDTGHRVIVDALTRDGRLQRDIEPRKPRGPIVIDEFASESDKDDEGGLPDIIKKMNERLGAELSINGLKGKNG